MSFNLEYKKHTFLVFQFCSCDQIPEIFLDKTTAKEHFKKYGKITRFILRPKRLSCTIEYDTREAAELALSNAGNFKGTTFEVYWTPKEMMKAKPIPETVDPDVQAELDAMGAQQKIGDKQQCKYKGFSQYRR